MPVRLIGICQAPPVIYVGNIPNRVTEQSREPVVHQFVPLVQTVSDDHRYIALLQKVPGASVVRRQGLLGSLPSGYVDQIACFSTARNSGFLRFLGGHIHEKSGGRTTTPRTHLRSAT